MSPEDLQHQPAEEIPPTASDRVPDFGCAALAVQNCLGRCKLGLAKADMFCGTYISAQFLNVEQIYKDIICLATLGSVETENENLESEAPQDESTNMKKHLEKLEESIMGVGAHVVSQNSKIKAELGTVLPHIQNMIDGKEREFKARISEFQREDPDGSEYTQQIMNSSEVNKDEDVVDISTIKMFQECSSILSILGALCHPSELSFTSERGEYSTSIAEVLDYAQDRVHERKLSTEAELQEHYALLDELSTLIDKVDELGTALEAESKVALRLL